jgi:hypothetical protein
MNTRQCQIVAVVIRVFFYRSLFLSRFVFIVRSQILRLEITRVYKVKSSDSLIIVWITSIIAFDMHRRDHWA